MGNNSTHATTLFNDGLHRMSAGDSREAEICFREAIRLVPDFAEAHANLGLLLEQEGFPTEAEHQYLHSISLNPKLGKTYSNLGALLADQKRFEEAETAYRRSLELIPDSPAAWTNLGVLQACMKDEKNAEWSHRKAIELNPDYKPAYFNLSYLLLRQGRLEEGWQYLESRKWYSELEKNIPFPRWRGEPLKDRSLLIVFEAGHGDMIQFCRYAAILKEQGTVLITILCHPALKALFTTMDGVDTVYAFDEKFPPAVWDYWTPPLSLPFHCKTRLNTIPVNIPYVKADWKLVEKWSSLLSRECGPSDIRVGLVWKGSPSFENDSERSLPNLKMLESLGTISGVRYFSLQKGAGEDESANPPIGLPLVDLVPLISDFTDSAAIIENLDLIICVDTAIAHLAGSMGKSCWVLLPDYKTDWRWLTGRTDSPWYPVMMRLFRQPRRGDWVTVIDEVHAALQRFVKISRPASIINTDLIPLSVNPKECCKM